MNEDLKTEYPIFVIHCYEFSMKSVSQYFYVQVMTTNNPQIYGDIFLVTLN